MPSKKGAYIKKVQKPYGRAKNDENQLIQQGSSVQESYAIRPSIFTHRS